MFTKRIRIRQQILLVDAECTCGAYINDTAGSGVLTIISVIKVCITCIVQVHTPVGCSLQTFIDVHIHEAARAEHVVVIFLLVQGNH